VSIVLSLLVQTLHIALMLLAAPSVFGAGEWLAARLSGRSGPPVLLPWRDLARLSRKTTMLNDSTSAASRLAPAVVLGATLSAAALVPSFALGMALSPLADVLVIVSLLSIGRVAAALAAFDSGAALPGVRQQSASARAVIAEPALMLALVALALMGGSFNLDIIIVQQREGVLLPAAASAVALAALLALLLAEVSMTDRGEPAFGGADLAMIRMAAWLRRLVWIDLIGGLFLPIGMATPDLSPLAWLIGLVCWAVKLAAAVLCLSAVRAWLGRVPRRGLPDLIGVAALLALLAAVMVLAGAALA
jgi:formate hydrogenlyase subunit 4